MPKLFSFLVSMSFSFRIFEHVSRLRLQDVPAVCITQSSPRGHWMVKLSLCKTTKARQSLEEGETVTLATRADHGQGTQVFAGFRTPPREHTCQPLMVIRDTHSRTCISMLGMCVVNLVQGASVMTNNNETDHKILRPTKTTTNLNEVQSSRASSNHSSRHACMRCCTYPLLQVEQRLELHVVGTHCVVGCPPNLVHKGNEAPAFNELSPATLALHAQIPA